MDRLRQETVGAICLALTCLFAAIATLAAYYTGSQVSINAACVAWACVVGVLILRR